MDNERLIHDYLDGTLDESGESDLFAALSTDSALRREFNEYLSMRPAFRQEAFSIAPDQELGNAVFSSLGYAINQPAITGGLLYNGLNSIKKLLHNRWITHTATIILSSVIAVMLYIFLFDDSKSSAGPDNTHLNQNALAVPDRPAQIETPGKKKIPAVTSMVVSASKKEDISLIGRFNEPEKQESNNDINNNLNKTIDITGFSEILTLQNHIRIPERPYAYASSIPYTIMSPEISENNFNISVNQIQNMLIQSDDIPSKTDFPLNISLSLGYLINDIESINLEFGREVIGQEFQFVYEDNNENSENYGKAVLYNVKQKPALWYGMLSYNRKFNSLGISGNLVPAAKIGFGMTEVGALSKIGAILYWMPVSGFSMNMGIEGTLMLYTAGGNHYLSRKAGLIYGMNFLF